MAVLSTVLADPATSMIAVAALQKENGRWDLEDALAVALSTQLGALHGLLKVMPKALPHNQDSWEAFVATIVARSAVERCATLLVSRGGGDPKAGRRLELSRAEEASPLGPGALKTAEEWLEATWQSVVSVGRGRSAYACRPRLEGAVGRLLDTPLPRPDWRAELAEKKRMSMNSNGADSCAQHLPYPPVLKRHITIDYFQQWRALTPAPVVDGSELQWGQAGDLLHLEGGSGGITLLHLPNGVVGIKSQKNSASAECLAGRLATSLGTRVAGLRVVPGSSAEFCEIAIAVKEAPTVVEGHRFLAKRALGNFVGLLEFVPGLSLQGVLAHDLMQAQSQTSLKRIWQEVGQLVAFDTLINNLDRVPLLWDNDGNSANIMIVSTAVAATAGRKSEVSVVGVDQAVMEIVVGPGRDRYLRRLQRLVRAAFSESWEEASENATDKDDTCEHGIGSAAGVETSAAVKAACIEKWCVKDGLHRAQTAFKVSCGLEMDPQAFLRGLAEGFRTIAESWRDNSLQTKVCEASKRTSADFSGATVDTGVNRLEAMQDFVLTTAHVIARAVAEPTNLDRAH